MKEASLGGWWAQPRHASNGTIVDAKQNEANAGPVVAQEVSWILGEWKGLVEVVGVGPMKVVGDERRYRALECLSWEGSCSCVVDDGW